MFTGIVQGKALIHQVSDHPHESFRRLTIQFPRGALAHVSQGASIAINGVCLTVTAHGNNGRNGELAEDMATFDAISETLQKTNLGELETGDQVNFERAAKIGDEIGGHLMSGHIICTAPVIERISSEANTCLRFKLPETIAEYILEKGFVGLNGCSLTLADVTQDEFSVYLIPETLEATTFGQSKQGDMVNLEVDPQTQTIVETVKKLGLKLSNKD